MSDPAQFGERLAKIETLMGIDASGTGVQQRLTALESSVDTLKGWQYKLMGIFAALIALVQLGIQVALRDPSAHSQRQEQQQQQQPQSQSPSASNWRPRTP